MRSALGKRGSTKPRVSSYAAPVRKSSRWRGAISAFADIHVTSASPPLNSHGTPLPGRAKAVHQLAGPRCLAQVAGYDVWMKWVDDLSLEVISTLTTAYDARTSLSTRTLLHLFDGAVRASHPMRPPLACDWSISPF
jgi:hypothetical protein